MCTPRRRVSEVERPPETMKLFVEPMDATVVDVSHDGRVRLESNDSEAWFSPSLQERRAIIYAAEQELAALTELLEILQS